MGNVIIAVIGAVLAMILGFIITFFTYKDNTSSTEITENKEDENMKNNIIKEKKSLLNKEIIYSPLKGTLLKLKESKDEAFASRSIG